MIDRLLKYIAEHRLVSLAAYFVVFVLLIVAFVELVEEVFEGETLFYDEAILNGINGFSTPFFDNFFVIITQLGGVFGIIAFTTILLAILLRRKLYQKALIVGATVAGAALLNVVLKLIFERTRPDLWEQLIVETSFSFPSGHSMITAALGLSLIFICWNTRYRWLAVALGSSFIIVIGFSRLYLGVHYPTDVLAGWVVSAAWLFIVVTVVNIKLLRKRSAK